MFSRLFLLFAMVPLAELWLLMELAKRTNWLTTIAVVLTTGLVGISLVRWQGINTWREIQRQLASGKSPSRSIVSGVLILVAGALLLTPGLITDTLGFLLLIPPVRYAVAVYLQSRFVTSVSSKFRSSVWVNSQTPDFTNDDDAGLDPSQRPSVRVVEPDRPAINDGE